MRPRICSGFKENQKHYVQKKILRFASFMKKKKKEKLNTGQSCYSRTMSHCCFQQIPITFPLVISDDEIGSLNSMRKSNKHYHNLGLETALFVYENYNRPNFSHCRITGVIPFFYGVPIVPMTRSRVLNHCSDSRTPKLINWITVCGDHLTTKYRIVYLFAPDFKFKFNVIHNSHQTIL